MKRHDPLTEPNHPDNEQATADYTVQLALERLSATMAICMNFVLLNLHATEGSAVLPRVSYADAANIMGVDVFDITWAIQEHGRCDVADWTAVPFDAPAPKAL